MSNDPPLPLFPVTTVGSFPRTREMQKALRQRQKGKITEEEFESEAHKAILEILQLEEEVGVDIVTDGEQNRDNFYSFITEAVENIRLMTLREMMEYVEDKSAFEQLLNALDVPAFAIKNPVVTGKIRRQKPLALDDYNFLKEHTEKHIKVPLPGPYLLTRSMWVKKLSYETYPTKESLGKDVVAILREELEDLRQGGCTFVQFDEPVLSEVAFAGPHETHSFMCAALSEKSSPEEELDFAVQLINEVVEGFEDIRTGLHVCRGNWSQKEEVLLQGAYDPLIPYFSKMNINQFVLEYATERAGQVEVLEGLPAEKEIGLGVCDPRTVEVENIDFMVDKVERVLKFKKPHQVFLNPDCGFGTFADRPVNTMVTARKKMLALHEAAKVLREKYGE